MADKKYEDFILALHIFRYLRYILFFPWSLFNRKKLLLWEKI